VTALSFCADWVRYWLVWDRQLQQPAISSLVWPSPVSLSIPAAPRHGAHAFRLAVAQARHGAEQRKAARMDVAQRIVGQEKSRADEDRQAALAAVGMNGKGDAGGLRQRGATGWAHASPRRPPSRRRLRAGPPQWLRRGAGMAATSSPGCPTGAWWRRRRPG